jgi:hypothetical protein
MASGRYLNYTTKIPVHQTVAECQSILAAAGASSAAVHFEDGQPAGLSFSLKTPHGTRAFTLPVNIDGVERVLAAADRDGEFAALKRKAGIFSSREHAARVAWRVIKDWLEANLALIAAEMVSIDEVMLPWLHIDDDRTLWQAYKDREQAALEAGGSGG